MKPYYQDASVTLYCGDCREVLPSLAFDLVVTDPPYGIDLDTDYWRPSTPLSRTYPKVIGDDEPFDPAWLLELGKPLALFGANHYADRLPPSRGWLVWDKVTRNGVLAAQISDGEAVWTNCLPRLRIFRHMWNGAFRDSERGSHLHPTQKPVCLMEWVLMQMPAGVVADPYVGAGATLVAAKQLGRRAVGVEISQPYCEVTARRLAQECLPLDEPEELCPATPGQLTLTEPTP